MTDLRVCSPRESAASQSALTRLGCQTRLLSHQAAFDALVELIPPKHYLANETDQEPDGGKFAKNKRKRAQNKGELAKLGKRAKVWTEDESSLSEGLLTGWRPLLLQQLDPDFKPSVLDIQEKKAAEASAQPKPSVGEPSQSGSSFAPMNTSKPGTIAELHARLQQKISELRNKRGAREESPAQRAKSKEEILEKRAKEKAKGNRQGQKAAAGSNGMVNGKPNAKGSKPDKEAKPLVAKEKKPAGDDFSFGKIEDSMNVESGKPRKKKDVNVLLKRAEAKEKKLAEKAQSKPEEARAEREQLAWAKAEKKALGIKSLDDVSLLKKSINRNKVEKKKSAKAWGERLKTEKRSQIDSQKSKSENLAKRKEGKKAPGERGKPKGGDKGKGKAGDRKKGARPENS